MANEFDLRKFTPNFKESILTFNFKLYLEFIHKYLQLRFPSEYAASITPDTPTIEKNHFTVINDTIYVVVYKDSYKKITSASVKSALPAPMYTSSGIKKCVFITNDFAFSDKMLNQITAKLSPDIQYSIWNPDILSSFLAQLSIDQLKLLLAGSSLLPALLEIIENVYDDEDILSDIFAYLKKILNKELYVESRIKELPTRISEKIDMNFGEYQKIVPILFAKHYGLIKQVEKFVTYRYNEDPWLVDALVLQVQTAFVMCINAGDYNTRVADHQVFYNLRDIIIPPENKGMAKYEQYSLAIIFYLFEYCDFGQRHPDDPAARQLEIEFPE